MTKTKISTYRQFAIYNEGGRVYAEATFYENKEDERHVMIGSLTTVAEEDLQKMIDEYWEKRQSGA